MAFIVIDWLCKQSVSLPYFKTTTAKYMARFYINNIYWNHNAPELIVLDRGPQFILNFWSKFYYILGIKIKLLTVFYP